MEMLKDTIEKEENLKEEAEENLKDWCPNREDTYCTFDDGYFLQPCYVCSVCSKDQMVRILIE